MYQQLGETVPDLDDAKEFEAAFRVTQKLVADKMLVAGHDRSDGGLITTIVEMCFAGNRGATVDVPVAAASAMDALFAEELGLVLEIQAANVATVLAAYTSAGIPCVQIGTVGAVVGPGAAIKLAYGGETVVDESVAELRAVCEATSFQLERLQADPACVAEEEEGMMTRTAPPLKATFTAEMPPEPIDQRTR